MPMWIDMDKLEPVAAGEWTKGAYGTTDDKVIAYSQAISLKRIADALADVRTLEMIHEAVKRLEERALVREAFEINKRIYADALGKIGVVPDKQTSPEVSALAAKYLAMDDRLMAKSPELYDDLRTLAASCLAQDETKGT